LDEATSELDPVGAEDIHALAGQLKDQGKTIIMVEHNIDELAKHADRIIVMNQGEIVRDNNAHEILTDVIFLQSLGIYPPQVTQTAFHLQERGWRFDRLPLNIVEAEQAIINTREVR
jgi:energy-coupling factor transporter ATP-binding protein EcfA2